MFEVRRKKIFVLCRHGRTIHFLDTLSALWTLLLRRESEGQEIAWIITDSIYVESSLPSSDRNPRGIDGMLLTKYDTVDDKASCPDMRCHVVIRACPQPLLGKGWCGLVHGLRDRLGP